MSNNKIDNTAKWGCQPTTNTKKYPKGVYCQKQKAAIPPDPTQYDNQQDCESQCCCCGDPNWQEQTFENCAAQKSKCTEDICLVNPNLPPFPCDPSHVEPQCNQMFFPGYDCVANNQVPGKWTGKDKEKGYCLQPCVPGPCPNGYHCDSGYCIRKSPLSPPLSPLKGKGKGKSEGKGPIGTYKSRNAQFITFWIAIGLFVILFMTSLTMKNKLAKPAAIFFTFGFAIAAIFLGLSAWGILPKESSKNK